MSISESQERMSFGEQLFYYRRRVEERTTERLSQAELGRRAGLSAVAISNLESGKHLAPRRGNVKALAAELDLSAAEWREFEAAADMMRTRRTRLTDSASPSNDTVPHYRTSLVGRADDIERLLIRLREFRLVTLTGAGGIGKTRLAIEIARRWSLDCGERVSFVDLSALAAGASPVSRIAAVNGVRLTAGAGVLSELVAGLGPRRLLLILDNCEHVLDQAQEAASAILQGCPDITILATSRERLRITGEAVHRVATLAFPAAGFVVTDDTPYEFPAVQLFINSARAIAQDFVVSDDALDGIAGICRRLDGMPLAIELIAGRMSTFTVNDLRQRLDQYFVEHLALVANGCSDVPARHRTLHAAIGWSYELLTVAERTIFRRLSIFASGWTLDAAQTVCADPELNAQMVLAILASLVEKSLVVFDSRCAQSRYRFLETTYGFARAELDASADADVVADRHLAWMTSFADRSDLLGWEAPIRSWLPLLVAEFDNARAALAWAHRRDTGARAAGIIAAAIGRWGYACGLLSEARQCVESELARWPPDAHPEVAARLWHAQSQVSSGARKVELGERAAAIFKSTGDLRRLALCSARLAGGYLQTGEYAKADTTLSDVRCLLRRIGQERSGIAAIALSWHATVHRAMGHLPRARELLIDSIRIYLRIGDEQRAANEKVNLAEIEFAAGDTKRAFELVGEAIATLGTADANGFQLGSAFQYTALGNAAAYAIALGDATRARSYAQAALVESQRAADSQGTTIALGHLATVAAMHRQTSIASRLCGYCDEALGSRRIVREPTEQRTYEVLLSLLGEQASAADLAAWTAAGRLLTENEAIDLALWR